MSNKCPKGDHPARRVYAQVTSEATGRSTTITLPFLYCGDVGTQIVGGRVVGRLLPLEKGQHGLVPVDAATFQAQRRQSIAVTSRQHPDWVKPAKAKAPTKPKAKAKTKAPAKAAARKRPAPKASATPKKIAQKRAKKARPAPRPEPPLVPPIPATAEPVLTTEGASLAAKAGEIAAERAAGGAQ